MVVAIFISAGLGNQLFQYACGRGAAKRLGGKLRLDLDSFAGLNPERQFGLRRMGITVSELNSNERVRVRLSCGRTLGRVGRLLKPVLGNVLLRVINDPQEGFCPEVIQCRQSLYLRGYWQSEKYFENVVTELRDELGDPGRLPVASFDLYRRLSETNSVCVHVRRGDLVTNPTYRSQYHIQEQAYYGRAIAYLTDQQPGAEFFVFSDDAEWPQNNLKFPGPVTFLNGSVGRADWEDLLVMSACRHFVIANSTFSWWAAWLSKAADKTVIAPNGWRIRDRGPPPDLIPEGWIVL